MSDAGPYDAVGLLSPGLGESSMPDDSVLREHLVRLLDWQDAHSDFESVMATIPTASRGIRPRGFAHSPWELLEHLRLCQRDILDFCRNPDYIEPSWPDDYWPATAEPPSESAWDECLGEFLADREAMKRLASDPTVDLYAPIPHGEGQTYLREVLLVADHNAYHLGQLVVVRHVLLSSSRS